MLGSSLPIDSSLGDLEVVGDLPDGHDGVVSWAGWHGLGRSDDSKGVARKFESVTMLSKYLLGFGFYGGSCESTPRLSQFRRM